MSAPPSCASRWACPRSCASSAAASSTPARSSEIDVSGPTLDESDGLRVGAGVGLSWLSPLGPLSIDFAQADREGGRRQDRVLPAVLRHPVLMRGACTMLGRAAPAARRWSACCSALRCRTGARPTEPLPPAVAAVIDYQRILREAKAARAIRDQVETRRKLYQDEIAKEEQRLHEADKELARSAASCSPEAFAEQREAFEREVAGGAADGAGAPAPAGPGRGRGAQPGAHRDDRDRGRARRRRAASTSSCRPAACCCSRPRST